ncbi:MAG: ergothioneine biosynthesis protein EgtB [Pyrinomonadaceae bacterium]|nr:ergothioneine biosynthesis protein EgtB [Pyrinomonadaceae bacterium]
MCDRLSKTKDQLIDALKETRARTLELVDDLDETQLMGPHLQIVNPLRWEIGHLAWFQEFWVLRHLGKQPAILKHGDELYDSARVAHDTRWDLPLLETDATLAYMSQVRERVIEKARRGSRGLRDAEGYHQGYFLNLVLLHEQMHDEAITYTRQTLSYPPPAISIAAGQTDVAVASSLGSPKSLPLTQTHTYVTGDAEIPGSTFLFGSTSEQGFVFDNEQLAHEVEIGRFAISKTAVSNGEFKHFVEDTGYGKSELWTAPGWQWRTSVGAEHPVYWRREGNRHWLRRNFDEWVALEERLPIVHVNYYEADAYCRWAGRRLPTAAEWEMAASAEPAQEDRGLTTHKRQYPWGGDLPSPERANLDWRAMGCIPVDMLPAGDSAFGCRQMIGNVWEWTASDFQPYPGFVAGPHKEYSEPWFGSHKVLRGGCWVTRSRLIHNSYRNFYTPDRRDVWAGFRTCAPQT